jgi:hypothetical protein
MTSATQIFEQIQQHAEANKSDRTIYIDPEIGQYTPQGDVNFLVLDKLPVGAIEVKPVKQLAPGTTRGSRHCIADRCLGTTEFYRHRIPNPLQGAILIAKSELEIEHPEHANLVFPAGTILAVGFQRQYANELKRAVD